jgi:hypothetical protein
VEAEPSGAASIDVVPADEAVPAEPLSVRATRID